MVDFWILALAFGISITLCGVAVLRPEWVLNQAHMLNDISAKQAQHTRPTPRVGGAVVIISLLIVGALVADQLGRDLIFALLAGFIVFAAGLREDIKRDVSPKMRLLAAFAAAAFAIGFSGQTVPGLGLVQTDYIFGWFGVGLLVTLLWSAGSCHALNLIDGLNGLASGYAICAAAGFWVIAGYTGDTDIQIIAGLLIAAVLGFFVLNWPMGRIFMGDAGAYAIGHVLAWLGILLMARNPEVTGFAMLLVMFWPVGDTVFSMIRRRIRRKATDQPDRLHFHHLVARAFVLVFNRGGRRARVNSVATIVMVPFFAMPILAGVVFWDEGVKSLFMLMFFTILFMSTYAFSMDYFASRRFRRRRAAADSDPSK